MYLMSMFKLTYTVQNSFNIYYYNDIVDLLFIDNIKFH